MKLRTPRTVLTLLTMLLVLSACGGSGGGGSTPVANKPPSLNLVASQTVVEQDLVTLSADGSSDSDGSIATIAWTQTEGTSVTLANADTLTPTFTAPITDVQLTLVFSVTLTDDDDDTASGSVTITINPNVPPNANAGADTTYVEQNTITLDGSSSADSDGTISIYEWTQLNGPTVTLTAAASATASFTGPDITADTALEFNLKVTDHTGDFHQDTVIISLIPNAPPSLSSYYPCDGCRYYGNTMVATGSASVSTYPASVSQPDAAPVITVSAGAGDVTATIAVDGRWVAQNVPVDSTATSFDLTVTATDSYGASTQLVKTLSYRPTLNFAYIGVDPLDGNILYFFEDGVERSTLFKYDVTKDVFQLLYEEPATPTFFRHTQKTAIDGNYNRILIADISVQGVLSIGLSDGAAGTLSSSSVGTGPSFSGPWDITVDADDNRAFVWSSQTPSILSVDLGTGNRTLIADNSGSYGTGPPLDFNWGMAVNQTANIMYFFTGPDLLEIDLTTGNRTTLSPTGFYSNAPNGAVYDASRNSLIHWYGNTDKLFSLDDTTYAGVIISDTGTSGINIGYPRQLIHNTLTDTYLINDFQGWSKKDTDAIFSIDPTTGARSVLMEDSLGTGAEIHNLINLVLDSASNSIFGLDSENNTLVNLDLTSNTRTVLSGNGTGTGWAFSSVRDLALDLANNLVYVIQETSLLSVDVNTGHRQLRSAGVLGSGTTFTAARALALDLPNNRALVLDRGTASLMAVDLATGDRTTISGGAHAGEAFATPLGMGLDSANGRVLITDAGIAAGDLRLFSVNLATGTRTIVTESTIGSYSLTDVELLTGTDQAVAISRNSWVLLVDLITGDRTTVYTNGSGDGEDIFDMQKLTVDATSKVIYGWSKSSDALFQIELDTGHRVVVSK